MRRYTRIYYYCGIVLIVELPIKNLKVRIAVHCIVIHIRYRIFVYCLRIILAQFVALEEENKRRRDECIQLRSILAQRTGIGHKQIGSMGNQSLQQAEDSMLQESELIQAFEATKVVNRQLESELTALTEENNAKIFELNREIDELKVERNKYQEILHNQISDRMDSSQCQNSIEEANVMTQQQKQQNINYLMHELKSISNAYAEVLEENNRMSKALDELSKKNQILSKRLRDHGIDDSIVAHESVHDAAIIHKRQVVYQGTFIFPTFPIAN